MTSPPARDANARKTGIANVSFYEPDRAVADEELATSWVEARKTIRSARPVIQGIPAGDGPAQNVGRWSSPAHKQEHESNTGFHGPVRFGAEGNRLCMAAENAGPGGISEIPRPFSDHQRRTRPVADVTKGNLAVRVQDAGALIGKWEESSQPAEAM